MRICLLLLAVIALQAAEGDPLLVAARLQSLGETEQGLVLRVVVVDVPDDAPLQAGALLDVNAADADAATWRERLDGLHRLELGRAADELPAAGGRWQLHGYHGAIAIEDPEELPELDTPEPREFARRAHELALRESGVQGARESTAADEETLQHDAEVDRLLDEVARDPGMLEDDADWQRFVQQLEEAGEQDPAIAGELGTADAEERERQRRIDAILGWEPTAIPEQGRSTASATQREATLRVLDVADTVLVVLEQGAVRPGAAELRIDDAWEALRVLASDGRYLLLSTPATAPAVGERLRLRQTVADAR